MKRAARLGAARLLGEDFFERWREKFPGTFRIQLAMSTAAVASTAVETAATAAVECIAAVIAAARVSAVIATADEAVGFATPVAVIPASKIATMSIVAAVAVVAATPVVTVAIVTATTVEAPAIVAAVEPGSGADEDAADEVIRPVIAVWSAGVRIVAVITISAGRCWPNGAVHGTYSNAHGKLCVSASRGKKKQNPQQSNIF